MRKQVFVVRTVQRGLCWTVSRCCVQAPGLNKVNDRSVHIIRLQFGHVTPPLPLKQEVTPTLRLRTSYWSTPLLHPLQLVISRPTLYMHWANLRFVIIKWYSDQLQMSSPPTVYNRYIWLYVSPVMHINIYILQQFDYILALQRRWPTVYSP